MQFIYDFWVEMCPFLQGYEFVYVFMSFLTLYVLLYAVVILPGRLLFGGTSRIWND